MAEKDEPKEVIGSQDDPRADPITAPISRSEVVRRALTAGFEGAEEGVAYIHKQFGVELSTSQFLAAKATERKRGWAKNGKPGRKSKQSPETGGGSLAIDRLSIDQDEDDLIA